jgi:hypothetical protein
LLKYESYDSLVNRLICYTVNYKTPKSKVYKMYLLKLGLLVRVLRFLLVKGRSACNGVVSRLIALFPLSGALCVVIFFFFGVTAPIWALSYLHETLRFTSLF